MDATFVNKYIENLNNEVGNMKQQDIINKTQNGILEKSVADLTAKVSVLNEKVVELSDKLNKKTVDARINKTPSKKKKSDGSRDGGDF